MEEGSSEAVAHNCFSEDGWEDQSGFLWEGRRNPISYECWDESPGDGGHCVGVSWRHGIPDFVVVLGDSFSLVLFYVGQMCLGS